MAAVNATGEVFLSPRGWAAGSPSGSPIGNIRTEERHVERAWELLRREAARIHV